ncbi:trypsin-like serine peptidase [Roseivivax isoporae]|uniref:Uncharacterized protein n=1 Tax=Roseivivax isoporae LMG 25204 TaxID=1449351 RepID=X7F592_9RHOB|nr:serine protease [Roseivivax isoporae]ETX27266.1 hypothetical protein RISW2_14800 [Roseivivax isoporae LMG 25204]
MRPADHRPGAARDRLRQLCGRAAAAPADPALEGLESAAATPETDLSVDRRRRSEEALRQAISRGAAEPGAPPVDPDETERVVGLATRAMEKLAAEGPEADLDRMEEMGLEAVIATDGSRPSALIRDGFVDMADPRLGDWADDLGTDPDAVRRAIAATGRVLRGGDLSDTRVFGTAWMIAPGLAATARHVVEAIWEQHGGVWIEKFGGPVTLDFGVEAGRDPDPAARIGVRGVTWASDTEIRHALNLANLDVAILELDAEGPPPLAVAGTLPMGGAEPRIHVIGHPMKPSGFGALAQPEFERIREVVFGSVFGVKRWAPGLIVLGPGSLPDDRDLRRVMTHDAATLGGNSGSPLLDLLDAPDRALGLHYGGFFEEENYAHPLGRVRDLLAGLPLRWIG